MTKRFLWLTALSAPVLFGSCAEVLNAFGEICAHSTYTVASNDPTGPDTLCDTTGRCQNLRQAMNTAEFCGTATTTKTIIVHGPNNVSDVNPVPVRLGARGIEELARSGPTALPIVHKRIVIRGAGIGRYPTVPGVKLRFFHVARGGHLTLEDMSLGGGNADNGSAIRNEGKLTLSGVRIHGGEFPEPTNRGAIYNSGEMSANSLTVFASLDGRACSSLYNEGKANIAATFEDNVARDNQSVVSNAEDGELTFLGKVIGNRVTHAPLVNRGNLTIRRATFANNVVEGADAVSSGVLSTKGNASIEASTFSQGAGGAAVACAHDANTMEARDVTIYANRDERPHVAQPSGLSVTGRCSITYSNTVVANNVPANCYADATARFLPQGSNADTDDSCRDFNLRFDDVGLEPLTETGNNTLTHPPRPGSPLINAGGALCGDFDQRGYLRSVSAPCDVGAVEWRAP